MRLQKEFKDGITQHKNSILNPDIVLGWAFDEPEYIKDRLERAKALLPNFEKYFSFEYPRAKKAVELWEIALEKHCRLAVHPKSSNSVWLPANTKEMPEGYRWL